MNRAFIILALLSSFAAAVLGQQKTPVAQPTPDDDVVKISTALIQVDVSVTYPNGKVVTDLRPEEIEVYENGKKQDITTFSFVNFETRTIEKKAAPTMSQKNGPPTVPAPPVKLAPGQVTRTIALVVDDLGLSFESMKLVQRSLRKFVDEQMQPGDLVAIVRTGSGVGALQQFTSDKRMLYAAIERVKWNAAASGKVGAFAPMGPPTTIVLPNSEKSEGGPDASKLASEFAQIREDLFTVGTLGAVNFVVNGMSSLPGRKSIVLFSDGISLLAKDPNFKMFSARIVNALQGLTDKANRAGVVIYSIDARGLLYLGLTAEDSTGSLAVTDDVSSLVKKNLDERNADFVEGRQGLEMLSRNTGGFLIKNTNDLNLGIESVLKDQKGYYLIGYQPDSETFDAKKSKYNELSIKVTRPGINVRYRSGFFGISDNDIKSDKPLAKDPVKQELSKALYSPFAAQDISLKLTPLFANDPQKGSYINTLLHVDANGLQFTDESGGKKKAVFDIVVAAFGDNGQVMGEIEGTQTLTGDAKDLSKLLAGGVNYTITFPMKKPGAYQLRVALRDKRSTAIGSASQFLEVPELKKDRAVLSGIVLRKNGEKIKDDKTAYLREAAFRTYKPESVLSYSFMIYNAVADKTGKPDLVVQAKIFRENKDIYAGTPMRYTPEPGIDRKRLPVEGGIQLASRMEPGEYVLQIIVTDMAADEKYRYASQWLDFEIVKD